MNSTLKKVTNNKSANSQVNGFAFQYAAAILIFIKEMKNVKAIGLEDTDDIRVLLKNDANIYAQAKSSLVADRIYSKSHLSTDIKDSLKTLYNNNSNNSVKLISIFNYHNPFGQQPTFNETKHMVKAYHNLTTDLQKKIREFCLEDENMLDKLEFWFLRFEDDDDPYSDLTNIVDNYIRRIDSNNLYTKDLITSWRASMEINGRDRTRLLDIKYLLGSIFNHVLVNAIKFDDVLEIIGPEEISYLNISKMSQIFNNKIRSLVSFDEYVNVLSAFVRYKSANPTFLLNKAMLYKMFADYHCSLIDDNIRQMFEDEDNSDLLTITYQKALVIAYVMKSDVIKKVKEVFNYDD